jgi:gliding motility-associated-like protein
MVDMEVQDYTWNIDGAHTSDGATEISGQGPYYLEWSNPGQHIVSLNITAKDQCDTKVSDTLMVHERPEAKIGSSATDVVCEGSDIELSASINNSKYQYKWAPLQMFDYDYNSPIVKVHADRSVYVSLEVTNEYGCTSMDSIMINTKPCCELLLPTAFSPNGDGKNDLFRILNPGRHKLESLKVFNRYGQEVYTTSDENAGWDGSYNGVAQDMGVYQYLVKFKCEGKDTYQKGDVTLVR